MGNMTNRPIATGAERVAGNMYIWAHIQGSPSVDRRLFLGDMVFKNVNGHVPSLTSFQVTGETQRFIGTSNFISFYNAANTVRNGYAGHFGTDFAINNDLAGEVTLGTNNVIRVRVSATGHVLAGADNAQTLGGAANRWSVVYAGTGTINTSDERAKTEISEIPDDWLDAWGDVQWQRFKFVDGNRWHVGLIAQAVHAAFAGHGLDAFDIGLCCYDEWQEERAPIFETVTKTRLITVIEQEPAGEDENGQALFRMREVEVEEEYQDLIDTGETQVTLEAGDRWGLRYDECQAIEAAWNRRELARMAARLTALESPAS